MNLCWINCAQKTIVTFKKEIGDNNSNGNHGGPGASLFSSSVRRRREFFNCAILKRNFGDKFEAIKAGVDQRLGKL